MTWDVLLQADGHGGLRSEQVLTTFLDGLNWGPYGGLRQ